MNRLPNFTKCFLIFALLIHSVISSSRNNDKDNDNERDEISNSSKVRKNNLDEGSSKCKPIRKTALNPNAAVFTPSSKQNLTLTGISSNRIAIRDKSYGNRKMVLSGSSSSNLARNLVSSDPRITSPGSTSHLATRNAMPGNSYTISSGQYNGLPINPAEAITPLLDPNAIDPHPAIGPSPFRLYENPSKINPFLEDMTLVANKARAIDPRAPQFSFSPELKEFVIITRENMRPLDATDTDEVLPINKVVVYDSSLATIYEAYPSQTSQKYYDTPEYRSIDPSLRKSNRVIAKEITKLVAANLVVGFKMKTKNFHYVDSVSYFNSRDLTVLIKFVDAIERKPSIDQWDLKDLVLQFFGNRVLPEPNAPFSSEIAAKYMRDLYILFRRKWDAEVQFLRRQIWYYKYVNVVDLKLIFAQYGPRYPGLHSDGDVFAAKHAQSVIPSNLYVIRITDVPDTRIIVESVSLYRADNFELIFRAFVDGDSVVKKPNIKYYALSEVARILVSRLKRKQNQPSVIVTGFNVLERMRFLDKKKELGYVTVYDSRKIFYGKSIAKMAHMYLHVDYRLSYLPDWKERNLTSHHAFVECDKLLSDELLAKISLQLFGLYRLHEHPRVIGIPLWDINWRKKKSKA